MGEAKARGTAAERITQAEARALQERNERLSVMIEEAEVIVTFRVDNLGKLRMKMLSRDLPPDPASGAVAFGSFLWTNFEELAGQAMSLNAAAVSGEADQFPEAAGGIVVLDSRGRDAKVDHAPVILGANGGVLTSDRAANPTIELPASAKETL